MGWMGNFKKTVREMGERKRTKNQPASQNSSRWFHNAKKEKYHYLQLAVILTNVL
jgi:hypothetical protein